MNSRNSQRNNNSNTRPRRRRNAPPPPPNIIYRQVARPSYASELVRTFRLPGSTQLVTTVGTAFAFTYALGNATSQIPDWTDISNMYDSYFISRVSIQIMCLTPPTPGGARWFFDSSATAGVPTVNDAEDRLGVLITNHSMNVNRVWTLTFNVRDYSLLSYRNTTVDYVFGYFKGITNLAQFGTSATNTLLYQYRAFYTVHCRGKKG